MNKAKKIPALLLTLTVAVSLLSAVPITASAANSRAKSAGDLQKCLQAASDGDVIDIEKSFTYDHHITINTKGTVSKGVKINLNGNDITFSKGVTVLNGKLIINGPGNLTVNGDPCIFVKGGNSDFTYSGKANISVATTSGKNDAVALLAQYGGGIRISKHATASGDNSNYTAGYAVYAVNNSVIEVGGNVSVSGRGRVAVQASAESRVRVFGNVTISGRDSKGAYSSKDSKLEISGNVKATGRDSIGAHATGGWIYIAGSVSGEAHDVQVRDTKRAANKPHKTDQIYNRSSCYLFEAGENTKIFIRRGDAAVEWRKEGQDWYYYRNGSMVKGDWLEEYDRWYYLKADGKMAAGWLKIGSKWYYFADNGAMQTGWLNLDGIWYYLKADGTMAENEKRKINGVVYNFNASGRCLNP